MMLLSSRKWQKSNLHLIHGFTARKSGNMSLFYGDTQHALENRKRFLRNLGIDYQDLVCAKQVHSNGVRCVQEFDRGKGAVSFDSAINDTDSLITDKKNLPLAIFTADCLSIFLYDPNKPAIGLVHAGYRSTKDNIIGKTIKCMEREFDTQPKDLCIGLGPSIRRCCYEVGKEFTSLFPYGLIERNSHYYLDLVLINKKQILDSQVKEESIFDSVICTSCQNKEFFSYRKEGNSSGRMMSVIMLKNK